VIIHNLQRFERIVDTQTPLRWLPVIRA